MPHEKTMSTNKSSPELLVPLRSAPSTLPRNQAASDASSPTVGSQPSERGQPLKFAKALYDFPATERDELMLEEEDVVQVLREDSKGGWMFGLKCGVWGWFPGGFVRVLSDDEAVAEGVLEVHDVGKLFAQPGGGASGPGGPSSKELAAEQAARRSSINLAASPSQSTLSHQSASTASLDEASMAAAQSAGGKQQPAPQLPGTRNWAAKYKAMPRYSKRVSGTGLDELETAIGSHIKEALSRPASAINMPSPDDSEPSSGATSTTTSKKDKEASRRSGGSLRKKDLKFLGGSFSDRNSKHQPVSFVLGAAPAQRARWVETMGGAEEVAKMGLDKRAVQRQEVIHEICATEKDYVEDLDIIINVYMNPMKRSKILPAKDMSIIFSNVEQLLPVNQQLKTWFEERVALGPVVDLIGDIFIRVSDFLKMYTMYCRNHPFALMKLQAVRQSKSVAKFLDQCAASPEARNLNLANFLIKPVQRICKYPLLIREAMKNTDPTHADYTNLQSALLKIETVVTIVNEGARQAEAVQKMLEIQGRFTTKMNIVAPWRSLLKSASMDLIKSNGERSRRESFLFNDMFVLAKSVGGEGEKLKLTDMVPFDMISINIPSVGDHLIEIGHVNAGRYILALETAEHKAAWIAALKDATKTWLASKTRGAPASAVPAPPMITEAKAESSTALLSSSPSLPEIQSLSAIELPQMDAIAEASAKIVQPDVHHTDDEDDDGEDDDGGGAGAGGGVVDDVVVKEDVPDSESAPPIQAVKSFQNQRVSLTTLKAATSSLRHVSPPASNIRAPLRVPSSEQLAGHPSDQSQQQQQQPQSRPSSQLSSRPPSQQPSRPPSQVQEPPRVSDKSQKYGKVAEEASALPMLPPLPKKAAPTLAEPATTTTTPAATTLSVANASPGSTIASRRLSQRLASNPFLMNDHGVPLPRATNSSPPPAATPAPPTELKAQPQQPSPNPLPRTTTAMNSATSNRNKPVRRAHIADVTRAATKDYVYHIQVFHSDGPEPDSSIHHTYDDFFDLHMQLIGHFPEEAGVGGSAAHARADSADVDMPGGWNSAAAAVTSKAKRIIPELPGQMMFVSEAAAKARIAGLQSYIQAILALPPKIARSPVTMSFFRADGKHALMNAAPAPVAAGGDH